MKHHQDETLSSASFTPLHNKDGTGLTLPGVVNVHPALMFTGLRVDLVVVTGRGVEGVTAVRPPAVTDTQVAHFCKVRWGRDTEDVTGVECGSDRVKERLVEEAQPSINLFRPQPSVCACVTYQSSWGGTWHTSCPRPLRTSSSTQ